MRRESWMKLCLPFKVTHLAGLLLLLESTAALADVLPGAAMPETVGKAITATQPKQRPVVLPPIAARPQQAPPINEAAQKIKFKLNKIELVGNHQFTTEQLSPIYKDKLGKVITVAQLFEIVQNITNYYRNNGYILSRAILPPQHVKSGNVQIQIIEGFIDKVNITGNPQGAKCMVKAYGEQIRACPPLEISRMEKYLLLANEIPGTEVRAVLEASKNKIGGSDLTLVTNNKLIGGYISYDDYGTRYIGPQQMTASFNLNSFAASGDTGRVTMTKTPKGGELTYIDANYNWPVNAEGRNVTLGGTRTHTHPLFVLQPTQVDGLTDYYYSTINFPFIRTRSRNLTVRTGFSYMDTHTTQLDANLYTDHLRNLDVGMTYNFADSWYGSNMIATDFWMGLPILGYTSNTNPDTAETSRPGGRGDYAKITLQMSRLQAIKGPFSLMGLFTGQWAFNPLLASQQFTFGGSQLGRGYDVAELIGDKGLAGSLELRYDIPIGYVVNTLEPYIFYDAGIIWNLKTNNNVPGRLSGTSAGVGTRFYFTKYISGNFMWTQTLTKQVAAEELIGDGRRPRVFFSVVASFS